MAPEDRGGWRNKAKRMVGEKEDLTAFLTERVLEVLKC